jgi:hypothetical protein
VGFSSRAVLRTRQYEQFTTPSNNWTEEETTRRLPKTTRLKLPWQIHAPLYFLEELKGGNHGKDFLNVVISPRKMA